MPADQQTIPLPWDGVTGSSAWTTALLHDIKASQLLTKAPLGISEFMPSFWQHHTDPEAMTKFWAHLIAMMAKFESSWIPTEVYHEPPPLSIDSIGLLQLSVPDGQSYHLNPPVLTATDLKDPLKNLSWGVQIMDHLVQDNNFFSAINYSGKWRGLGAYWSVMRSTNSDGSPRHSYYTIRSHMLSVQYP